MEFKFNKYCPVEFYQTNLPKGKKRIVLLPFYSYKVFAPKPKDTSINIFQKAILGIYNIAKLEIDEISQQIGLHRELVKFINSELVTLGFITKDKEITQQGKEVLREDLENFSINHTEYITGYVYQNPLTLQLYPRFHSNIKVVEVIDPDKQDFPYIDLGSKGSPQRENVFWGYVQNNLKAPSQPESISIIDAVKRHNRAIQNKEDQQEDIGTLASSQEQRRNDFIQKVNVIGEPQRIFLAVYIVYPEESISRNSWKVFDPFGLGESQFLKEYIQTIIKENHKLEEYIEGIWNDTIQRRNQSNDIFKMILESAEEHIHSELDIRIKDQKFYDSLLELELHYRKYDLDKRLAELKLVLKESQKILEEIFNKFHDDYEQYYNPKFIEKNIINGRDANKEYINRILKGFGYKNIPVPDAFSRLDSQKVVVSATYYKTQSLRPKITITILACKQNSNHPFLKMLEQLPDFFNEVYRISKLRDLEEHAGEPNPEFKIDEPSLLQVRKYIYEIIKVYLEII